MNNVIGLNGKPIATRDESESGGYISLGYIGNCSYIFSRIQQRVVGLRPTHMNEMTLKATCGAEWCEANYMTFHPKKEEVFFDHKALATRIIASCQREGLYSDGKERRFGVWPAANRDSLLVNGAELWDDTGRKLRERFIDGQVYPNCGDVGFSADTKPAKKVDVDRVLKAFGAYEWRQSAAPELLLGWLVCAYLAPALSRRPHIYFTGPAGIGKSVLLQLAADLLGPLAHKASGPQTKASLYQSLGGTPRAVVLDEAEADSSNRRWAETLEIARISYSLAEGDSGINVGTPSGNAKSYRFFSPFLAAGIVPAKFQPADLSRWAILEASGRKEGAEPDLFLQANARELGARLGARAVRNWRVLSNSLEEIRAAIQRAGGDARVADTVGPLIAGYWTMVSDVAATSEDADLLAEYCGIQRYVDQREETDEVRCFESLMSRVLPLPLMQGDSLVRPQMSLAEAVRLVCDNPGATLELQNRLTQLGLRVTHYKGRWVIMVANSPEHVELRKLFRGTKWQHGGWSVTLRRMPGGEENTQRLGLGGHKAAKVTLFDVPAEMLEGITDGGGEQAA